MDKFLLDVARGNTKLYSSIQKFGYRTVIGVSAFVDIWDNSGETWVAPTTARVHEITAGAADTAAGTGARAILIEGLDANGAEQSETVVPTGASAADTANSYTMIHRMSVISAGSGGANAAAVVATAKTDGTVTAEIATGNNQTLMAIYRVPTNKTAYLCQWYGTTAEGSLNATVQLRLYFKPSGGVWQVKNVQILKNTGTTNFAYKFAVPLYVKGGTTIKVAADASADTNVAAGFDLILDGTTDYYSP